MNKNIRFSLLNSLAPTQLFLKKQIKTKSYETKIKGYVPSGGSRGESTPCLFQLSDTECLPWLLGHHCDLCFHHHISLSATQLFLTVLGVFDI